MFAVRFLTFAVVVAVATSFGIVRTARFNSALNANIVDTAAKVGIFNTLIAAVKAAGLTEALSADKLTVFAPTDEAFAKLPAGTVEALLADIPTLTRILKYHVHPGIMNPTRTGRTLDTLLEGADNFPKQLTIKVTNWECESYVFAGQETPAKVIEMGIKCDNGLIHVINEVLLPYEGNVGPTVTFIGLGGIKIAKTLQQAYYGPEAGKGRDPEGIKGGADKVYEPISVGSTWVRAGNWDNTPDYFAEEIKRKET